MKILVTGALGFFGLNLVRYLAGQGQALVVMADIRQPTAEQARFLQPVAGRVQHVSLNILDREAIQASLHQHQISHVVHAAALTPTLAQETQQPTQVVDVNLGGTLNMLDAVIRHTSVQRLILASSSGVYGASSGALGETQLEAGPFQLDNLYSITKRNAELLLQRYSQLSGISMVAARLPPLYGPLEFASSSRPRMSAVGQLMAALRQGRAVRVAGPMVSRDWTYMADGAAAVWTLLQAKALSHTVYNVSCGVAAPWREVVDAFVTQGLSVNWVDDSANADIAMRPEQARLPMDISRLTQDTGFTPRYSLQTGVEDYLAQELQLGSMIP